MTDPGARPAPPREEETLTDTLSGGISIRCDPSRGNQDGPPSYALNTLRYTFKLPALSPTHWSLVIDHPTPTGAKLFSAGTQKLPNDFSSCKPSKLKLLGFGIQGLLLLCCPLPLDSPPPRSSFMSSLIPLFRWCTRVLAANRVTTMAKNRCLTLRKTRKRYQWPHIGAAKTKYDHAGCRLICGDSGVPRGTHPDASLRGGNHRASGLAYTWFSIPMIQFLLDQASRNLIKSLRTWRWYTVWILQLKGAPAVTSLEWTFLGNLMVLSASYWS
jgi:hypothetical protein